MSNYYDRQLQTPLDEFAKAPKEKTLQIVVKCEGLKTHHLNINPESIESLRAFLNIATDIFEDMEFNGGKKWNILNHLSSIKFIEGLIESEAAWLQTLREPNENKIKVFWPMTDK